MTYRQEVGAARDTDAVEQGHQSKNPRLPHLQLGNGVLPPKMFILVLRIKLESRLGQVLLVLVKEATLFRASRGPCKQPSCNNNRDRTFDNEEILPALVHCQLPD
jgi:hypothetical protein